MDAALVSIEDVVFSYRKNNPVLNGLNMRIPGNCVFALLGHNGAGKTTILRLIAKLIKPKSGSVTLDNIANIGFMPEGIGLYPRLSGYNNLKIRLLAYNKSADKKDILGILEKIDLLEHANKQAGLMSSGMKRRLALACSLTAEPELLLLDEPFSGIDPVSQKIMLEMLKEKAQSCTVVFSSHDLHLVKNISTVVSIIKNGRLEFISDKRDDIENIETLYFDNH